MHMHRCPHLYRTTSLMPSSMQMMHSSTGNELLAEETRDESITVTFNISFDSDDESDVLGEEAEACRMGGTRRVVSGTLPINDESSHQRPSTIAAVAAVGARVQAVVT